MGSCSPLVTTRITTDTQEHNFTQNSIVIAALAKSNKGLQKFSKTESWNQEFIKIPANRIFNQENEWWVSKTSCKDLQPRKWRRALFKSDFFFIHK